MYYNSKIIGYNKIKKIEEPKVIKEPEGPEGPKVIKEPEGPEVIKKSEEPEGPEGPEVIKESKKRKPRNKNKIK